MGRLRAAVLGATGMVGQRFVSLLQNHPDFEISVLAATSRSAGKKYAEACKWVIESGMPEDAAQMEVLGFDDAERIVSQSDIVFSALPKEAGKYESGLSDLIPLISKSSAHRMDPAVPLMIPGINDEHLSVLEHQKSSKKGGFLSCDPNCSSTQLAIVIKAVTGFGVERVFVDSMQAISGAGYPGLSSLEIQDNIIPYIDEEEAKLRREPQKILGGLNEERNGFIPNDIRIIAKCNRVNVSDGHMQSVFIKLGEEFEEEDVEKAIYGFKPAATSSHLHSFPDKLIRVMREPDRPQPKFDRFADGGMSVQVGRIEKDGEYLKLSCLSHNTILGAAGGAILHAELLKSMRII